MVSIGLLGLRKMGRKTWFNDDGMKKGEWIAEEDEKLIAYINEHGMCDWRSIPKRAGMYIELLIHILTPCPYIYQ